MATHGDSWDIYGNDENRLACIAVTEGHITTHYGDLNHLKTIMKHYPNWNWELSDRCAEQLGERFMDYFHGLQQGEC
jgi:hypothetical protein